jgi:5-methylcytosine-specific restriction endonuclease McrA
MCGEPADQWDHVIALARGGTGWSSNLRPACARDNQSKGARPV